MPVKFTPDNVPRYESQFLNYVNQNFQQLKNALQGAAKENITSTPPANPYAGETYYDPILLATYRWDGAAWKEESFIGNKSFILNSSGVTVPTATLTIVPWTTTSLDTDLWTESAGTFTCVRAGYYAVSCNVQWQLSAAGVNRGLYLNFQGVYEVGNVAPPDATVNPRVSIGWNRFCAAGEQFTVYAYQDSGGNLTVDTGVSTSYLMLQRTDGS